MQTAQVDERVRGKELPDDVFQESLEYILAHEVGHCLGLMHNMGRIERLPRGFAPQRIVHAAARHDPLDHGLRAFQLRGPAGRQGVKLTPPDLGPYDDYVIKYAYTPLPDKKDMFDEEKTIRGCPEA